MPKCALRILQGHVNLLKVSCKPFQDPRALIQQFLIMIPVIVVISTYKKIWRGAYVDFGCAKA